MNHEAFVAIRDAERRFEVSAAFTVGGDGAMANVPASSRSTAQIFGDGGCCEVHNSEPFHLLAALKKIATRPDGSCCLSSKVMERVHVTPVGMVDP